MPQLMPRTVEAGLGGPERDADGLGRLRQGRVEVVEEDDDCPQVGIQAAQCALQDVAIRRCRLRVRHVEVMDRRDLDLDRSRRAPRSSS